MAQAPLKKSGKPSTATTKSSSNNGVTKTKKGARTIAPKNAKLAKQAKMTKKFSAGLINETERMLGARAGHLEMLGGGKKSKGGKEGGAGGKKGTGSGSGNVKGKGRS